MKPDEWYEDARDTWAFGVGLDEVVSHERPSRPLFFQPVARVLETARGSLGPAGHPAGRTVTVPGGAASSRAVGT